MRAALPTPIMHTRATLDQLRVVFSSLQDAETGAQGYVLTGNEETLSPYYAAEHSLEGQLDRLTQLAAEGEGQQIAKELVALARAQLSFINDVVTARRSQDAAAALELLRGGAGKRQMDRIRDWSRRSTRTRTNCWRSGAALSSVAPSEPTVRSIPCCSRRFC